MDVYVCLIRKTHGYRVFLRVDIHVDVRMYGSLDPVHHNSEDLYQGIVT